MTQSIQELKAEDYFSLSQIFLGNPILLPVLVHHEERLANKILEVVEHCLSAQSLIMVEILHQSVVAFAKKFPVSESHGLLLVDPLLFLTAGVEESSFEELSGTPVAEEELTSFVQTLLEQGVIHCFNNVSEYFLSLVALEELNSLL